MNIIKKPRSHPQNSWIYFAYTYKYCVYNTTAIDLFENKYILEKHVVRYSRYIKYLLNSLGFKCGWFLYVLNWYIWTYCICSDSQTLITLILFQCRRRLKCTREIIMILWFDGTEYPKVYIISLCKMKGSLEVDADGWFYKKRI